MNTRTEREFHIALGKLLDKVRVQNQWNINSFREASTHVVNISKSEASRFYQALVNSNLLIPGSDKRKLAPNWEQQIWRNEDARIGFIREILEINPDIVQKRGPKFQPKVEIEQPVTIEEPVVIEEPILSSFTAQQLVEELRSRGYIVTATKEITVIEQL